MEKSIDELWEELKQVRTLMLIHPGKKDESSKEYQSLVNRKNEIKKQIAKLMILEQRRKAGRIR